jgi:hypothetical protein
MSIYLYPAGNWGLFWKWGQAKVTKYSQKRPMQAVALYTSEIWWVVMSLTPDLWAMVRRSYWSDQGVNFSIFKQGILINRSVP